MSSLSILGACLMCVMLVSLAGPAIPDGVHVHELCCSRVRKEGTLRQCPSGSAAPPPAALYGVQHTDRWALPRGWYGLRLRGGSSAWRVALDQHAGQRHDLSLEDTCNALKAHGLAVSTSQVKELLRLNGAADVERVSEAHFAAALAAHPPTSVMGRWQQKARFQAACSHAMGEIFSVPAAEFDGKVLLEDTASASGRHLDQANSAKLECAESLQNRRESHSGADKSAAALHDETRNTGGWASLTNAGSLSEDVEMNLHGSMDPGAKESYKGSEGTTPKPTSKRSIASSTDLSNRFSVLQDHAAGGSGGATGGRDDVQAALERKSGLVTADDVGVARRHVKAMVNENETGAHTQKDRQALKALKPLMSLSEWHKLSSAKQRKKMRKLSARQEKEELLRAQLLDEANQEEAKLELAGALSIGSGSGRLSTVATAQRFDEANAGRGMQLSQGGLVVRKAPGVSTATYVFWGSQLTQGISRWALRIDRQRSSFYIGAAVLPLDPDEGFAKYLQSSAWMLSDSGILFQTQQGTARNRLRDRLVPSPDGGHTVEVTIPSLGTATFTAKNKFRKHRYAFKDGSLIKMELDRDAGTLRFCVDNKQWVTLTGVSNHARPFLNFFTAGEGATLLQAEDGRSMPGDLI